MDDIVAIYMNIGGGCNPDFFSIFGSKNDDSAMSAPNFAGVFVAVV